MSFKPPSNRARNMFFILQFKQMWYCLSFKVVNANMTEMLNLMHILQFGTSIVEPPIDSESSTGAFLVSWFQFIDN